MMNHIFQITNNDHTKTTTDGYSFERSDLIKAYLNVV